MQCPPTDTKKERKERNEDAKRKYPGRKLSPGFTISKVLL
jgi:hypothetical protein